jgi:hypothetical protein
MRKMLDIFQRVWHRRRPATTELLAPQESRLSYCLNGPTVGITPIMPKECVSRRLLTTTMNSMCV